MENIEKEIKKQGEKIDNIEKNIKVIKRIYLTSLIIKILIIAIPIVGLVISMPHLVELYETAMEAVTVN